MKYKYKVLMWDTILEEWDEVGLYKSRAEAEDIAYNLAIEDDVKTRIETVL